MNSGDINLHDISIQIGGAIEVRCTNLSAKAGAVVGLVGRNGSGKSTFLKGVTGLLGVRSGTASIADRHFAIGTNLEDSVAYVDPSLAQCLPEDVMVVDFVEAVWCANNATPWYRRYWKAGGRKELARQGLINESDTFPEEIMYQSIKTLSAGQRQLLCLGVILLHKAPLRLVDEISSNLDVNWARIAFKLLKETTAKAQSVTLVVSHDVQLVAEYADACYLVKGTYKREGNARGILATVEPLEWHGSNADRVSRIYSGLLEPAALD